MPFGRRKRLQLSHGPAARRWWHVRWPFPLLLLVITVAAVVWVGGRSAWYGWNVRPEITSNLRDLSMARAKAGMGPRWLANRMILAESLSAAADVELVRQDARRPALRDYRRAKRLLGLAVDVADIADQAGARTEEEMLAKALAAIEVAAPRVQEAANAADLVRLTAHGRRRLERARLALEEARTHLAGGRHLEAVELAGQALEDAALARSAAVDRVRRFADPGQRRTWLRAVDDTVAWSRRNPGLGAVVVDKEARVLAVFVNGKPVMRLGVELGMAGVQPKRQAGDDATPEGQYRVVQVKSPGQSRFYKALLLDYPNDEDRRLFEQGVRAGRLRRGARLGSGIAIHGQGGKGRDWTHGCVAVTNDEMDALFRWVGVGSPVTIVGSAGSGGSLTDLARPSRRGQRREAP